MTMKRRDLLKLAAASAAVWAARPGFVWAQAKASPPAAEPKPPTNAAAMPKRPFGRSGIDLSIVGLGGLVLARLDQDASNRLVAEAFERGINYFDVAPEYGDAEVKMGPALEPYRQKVFLACKTAKRTAAEAAAEFKRSLERLRTDHLDLYQLHHIRKVDADVDAVFAKGGAWEFIQEARKDGRIRHLGFSAHTEEAAVAALDKFPFDSVMYPLSYPCWYGANWGRKVLEKAKAKGAAVMAIKSLARQRWPKGPREPGPFSRMWYQPITDPEEQSMSVRWSLSQGATAILPPSNDVLHRRAFEIGLAYTPITPAETEKLAAAAAQLDAFFKPGQEP
jgi:aryl-alcohol dehydrogenase-like predicted oxidoreductase